MVIKLKLFSYYAKIIAFICVFTIKTVVDNKNTTPEIDNVIR